MRKCFWILFLSLLALTLAADAAYFRVTTGEDLHCTRATMLRDVALARQAVENEMAQAVSDLKFLANLQTTRDIIGSSRIGPMTQVYDLFSLTKKKYDQIRLLDSRGMELFRINFVNGLTRIVPKRQLQYKGDCYYFKDIMAQKQGRVCISPLDLNVELGRLERPLKPVIRFGVPVLNATGTAQGAVVLNYLGAIFLENFGADRDTPDSEMVLLNQDSYWLKGNRPEDEWGFMLADRKDRTFQADYPREWEIMNGLPEGIVSTENGLFAYSTINLGDVCDRENGGGSGQDVHRLWLVVSHVPQAVLDRKAMRLAGGMAMANGPVVALLAILAYFVARFRARSRKARAELLEQNVTFERFIPKEFLSLMGKGSLLDVHRSQSSQHELTVLFSDIRSYTKLSEGMSPAELFKFLNDYFSSVGLPISENHGFIDKYMGDAVMALFPGSPEHALLAAIQLQKGLRGFSLDSAWSNKGPIRSGVGLHYGEVTLGAVGTSRRQQTTVVGDTVNLASRLESASKTYKVDIVLSEAVYAGLPDPDRFLLREIDTVRVKGKDEPVMLYEAFDADPSEIVEQKLAALPSHREAMACWRAGDFERAIELFAACAEICPGDGIPQLYIKRCNTMLRIPPGRDWAGVSTL